MLLGKSSYFRQIIAADKTEGWLALFALYALLLLPIAMIFSRAGAEITAGVLSLIFLLRSFRVKNWAWLKRAPVVIALILWIYSLCVVTPLALDPHASFSRADWVRFIPMFAAIAYWLSDYHEELKKIARVMLWVLFLAGADALYQYISGFSLTGIPQMQEQLTGPFGRVVVGIYMAKLSLPVLGILLFSAWRKGKEWQKWLLLSALLYCFVVILLSQERTAIITFSFAMVFLALGFFFLFRQARPILFALVLISCAALIGLFQVQPELQERLHITHERLQNISTRDYVQLWKASFLLWQEHPLTGVGMLNFRTACPKLLEEGRVTHCDAHSHNLYLEVLSEFGTIGFILMLSLVLSLIMAVFERHSSEPREQWILTFFASAGLLINFFPMAPTQSFFSNWPALLAWQSIAWSLAIMRSKEEKTDG